MAESPKKRIKPVVEEVVAEGGPAPESVEASESEVGHVECVEQEGKVAGVERPRGKTNIKLVIIITIVSALVAAVVSGGVYVYLSGVESFSRQATPTPTPELISLPTPVPTESPEPEPVDLGDFSVQVLNGSGTPGAARAGEDVLVKAGFRVASTGNAANYNFEATVVQAKPNVAAEVVSEAKKALEGAGYKVEIGEALASSSEYDIVAIIGSN